MSDHDEPRPPCCEAWRECCGDDACVNSGDSCHSGTCTRFRDEVGQHTASRPLPSTLSGKMVEVLRLAAGFAFRRLVISLFKRFNQ